MKSGVRGLHNPESNHNSCVIEGHTGLSIQLVFGFLEALLIPYNNTPQFLLQNVSSTFNTHIFLLRLVLSVEKREN